MANTVSVIEKPIPEEVSKNAYVLGIQDDSHGSQALYRMPINAVRKDDDAKNIFANALNKTQRNIAQENITFSDGVVGSKLNSFKMLGFCMQSSNPQMQTPIPITVNNDTQSGFNDAVYVRPAAFNGYGIGDIIDEYDIVNGIVVSRIGKKTLTGTSNDGLWSTHIEADGKYCYKLQDADISMLPSTYGNYLKSNCFLDSGRNFYINACSAGTVSLSALTDVTANKNCLFFCVGASIGGFDTSTLPGFLTWVAQAGVDVYYVRSSTQTTSVEPQDIMLSSSNVAVGSRLEIAYVQDLNKKIAEIEALIASLSE